MSKNKKIIKRKVVKTKGISKKENQAKGKYGKNTARTRRVRP